MNCAERLVSIFGSQAEVARRFRLDRAVVNNWVKSGYVPARWAMEVEHATEGKVAGEPGRGRFVKRDPFIAEARALTRYKETFTAQGVAR